MKHRTDDHSTQFTSNERSRPACSRRTILQGISATALTGVLTEPALSSELALSAEARKTRSLRIDHRFVIFPINNTSSTRRVKLMKNGHILRSFTASLGLPAQWWAHLDASEWKGQALMLSIEPDDAQAVAGMEILGRGPEETDNSILIAAVRTSSDIWSPETLYREPLRPMFHFSPRRGWNNDPNGLMYHNGRYHMFFQHNPYGVRWGNMHWGHAVSSDLIHWEELPIALYPRGVDDFPYSGAGVVDHDNTSGWAKSGRPPMVVAFTSSGRGECIAYSQDDGVNWKEFEGNPVIEHSGRDPKLLWHPETKQWVMAVYSERPGRDPLAPPRQGIAFHTSPDLKSWRERSWIEGYYECPELFPLPVDGDPDRIRWVLSCAPGYYSIGQFDGSHFVPEISRLPAPAGGGRNPEAAMSGPFPPAPFYAAQTFSNHPQGDRVEIAWGLVPTVSAPFTQMMSFPTKLSLQTTAEGVRLCREPVDTIRLLRVHTYSVPAGPATGSPLMTNLKGEAWDIEAVISVGAVSHQIMIKIGGDEFMYQTASQTLHSAAGSMSIPLSDGRLRLRILVDRTTIEVFGDRGQAYGMFIRSIPNESADLAFRAWRGSIEVLNAHLLRSAWRT